MLHTYYRDPRNGTGNCFCGHPERAQVHQHTFMHARDDDRCTCGLPAEAVCHYLT